MQRIRKALRLSHRMEWLRVFWFGKYCIEVYRPDLPGIPEALKDIGGQLYGMAGELAAGDLNYGSRTIPSTDAMAHKKRLRAQAALLDCASLLSPNLEQVLRYDTAVKVWNVKEPIWRWGDKHWGYMATLCNLMLTNKRLVFIEVSDKVDTGYFTGVPALDLLDTMEAMNREKARAAEIEATDLDKLRGDQVPLQNILEVNGYRHWKSLSGAYYLRVRYRSNGEERFKSVIFGEGLMAKKDWIEAITNAKNYQRNIITKPTHRTTPMSE